MPAVIRVGDKHLCPMTDPKPHGGGEILGPGVPTIQVGDSPIAVVGDKCKCLGSPAGIKKGSETVFADDKAVARVGDDTDHGGVLLGEFDSVEVG